MPLSDTKDMVYMNNNKVLLNHGFNMRVKMSQELISLVGLVKYPESKCK